jgi:hypothetical protein
MRRTLLCTGPLRNRKGQLCCTSQGIRSTFSLLCVLTSQLLLCCVHVSLSACYDWPTNPLLLLTVCAVCINLCAVKLMSTGLCFQWQHRNTAGSEERAVCRRQVQCLGTAFVPGVSGSQKIRFPILLPPNNLT